MKKPPLLEKDDKGRLMFNISLFFTVPFLQRYMKHYDIYSDSFVTSQHVLTMRVGSRRTEKWYQKFITTGWVRI